MGGYPEFPEAYVSAVYSPKQQMHQTIAFEKMTSPKTTISHMSNFSEQTGRSAKLPQYQQIDYINTEDEFKK